MSEITTYNEMSSPDFDDMLVAVDVDDPSMSPAGTTKKLRARRVMTLINLFHGRLTLESGVAVPTTDQTAKSTVYLTPYHGTLIDLYDGTRWAVYALVEVSVAVPSTLFRLFDVFVYISGGMPTLEAVNWNQTTGSVTGATNATPIVITSNGHGLSAGDLVGMSGLGGNTTPNGRIWVVENPLTNTFELGASVGNGTYTSGGTWYKIPNTRATALATQNNVLVKSGDATRRFCGTLMTTGTSGQTEDSVNKRFCWNCYNRVPRRMVKKITTASWTYNSTGLRPFNNDPDLRVHWVTGVAEDGVILEAASEPQLPADDGPQLYIGINQIRTVNDTDITARPTPISGAALPMFAFTKRLNAAGYKQAAPLEATTGGSGITYYGSDGVGIEPGISGMVFA